MRALAPADASDVLRINSGARPGVAALTDVELERLTSISRGHMLVALCDARVAGYLLAFESEAAYDGEEFRWFRDGQSEAFVYVDQIAVAEGRRGRGAGSALYAAIGAIARDIGAGALCCEVNTRPPNTASLEFHKKLGFVVAGSMVTADGREVDLLCLRLSPGPE
ncbi:MAG: GNAT family N-acetyltransferase [Gammaproteobacteria bacterium]